MSHVATVTHEVRGTILWDQHGCSPYWATRKLVQAADGGGTYELEIDGDQLHVSVGYTSRSGISPRPQDDVDQLVEYQV